MRWFVKAIIILAVLSIAIFCFMYTCMTFIIFVDNETKEYERVDVPEKIVEEYVEKQSYGFTSQRVRSEFTYDKTSTFKPIDCALSEDLQRYTSRLCDLYNIDEIFVFAIMQHESGFNSNVVSNTGDYGLMQINECAFEYLQKNLGVTNLLDAKQNIRSGVFILSTLFEKYHDEQLVLMCYNLGEGGARSLWEDGVYSTRYSEIIYEEYQKLLTNCK